MKDKVYVFNLQEGKFHALPKVGLVDSIINAHLYAYENAKRLFAGPGFSFINPTEVGDVTETNKSYKAMSYFYNKPKPERKPLREKNGDLTFFHLVFWGVFVYAMVGLAQNLIN